MHELVIRGGTVVDGTGGPARTADVAVDGQEISAVGEVTAGGRREIDADGLLVLPGWVDVHTHYDGQAIWDDVLGPSSWHGVTTTVFGNCSVGFAPVKPGSEAYLITLMEGVEDIPGSVLSEGIDFTWESFPEYLDELGQRQRAADVGAQVPHGALRFYVMGDRGADHEEVPTDDEIAEMSRLVAEALGAGAFGFSTSRTVKHRASDGRFTPGLTAGDPELLGIARAMGAVGKGVIQANSDFNDAHEIALLRALAEVSGRPVWFSLLQVDEHPDRWRELLGAVHDARSAGLSMSAQVAPRAIGIMMGLDVTIHPLMGFPMWGDLARLDREERNARLRDPAVRRTLLADVPSDGFTKWMDYALTKTFELGDPPDYEPHPSTSVAARAEALDGDKWELALDLMLADDGRALLYFPFENYAEGSLDAVREMLLDPATVVGLGDGGAHVGTICDASFPTSLLTHWVRDRTRGERLPLEHVVHRQTAANARFLGLADRGEIRPGQRADINVVDLHGLRLHPPEITWDLPTGGRRLLQKVDGYRHTFCAGTETFADGEWTGATPGKLMRA